MKPLGFPDISNGTFREAQSPPAHIPSIATSRGNPAQPGYCESADLQRRTSRDTNPPLRNPLEQLPPEVLQRMDRSLPTSRDQVVVASAHKETRAAPPAALRPGDQGIEALAGVHHAQSLPAAGRPLVRFASWMPAVSAVLNRDAKVTLEQVERAIGMAVRIFRHLISPDLPPGKAQPPRLLTGVTAPSHHAPGPARTLQR